MKSPLDTLDRELVKLLQANGRASMQDLSNETGLSRSAVFTRVRRLEHDGVITGYAAQTNRRALGLQIRAFCNVQLKQHDARFLKEFEANIGDFKEVQSCYHIAGAFDYLIAVDVPDMDAYHEFISHKLAAMDNIEEEAHPPNTLPTDHHSPDPHAHWRNPRLQRRSSATPQM